jgi:hypothetical protein
LIWKIGVIGRSPFSPNFERRFRSIWKTTALHRPTDELLHDLRDGITELQTELSALVALFPILNGRMADDA